MFSICRDDFFLGRRKPAPVICANAKMPSTKTCGDLKLRIQGRQSARRRLRVAEKLLCRTKPPRCWPRSHAWKRTPHRQFRERDCERKIAVKTLPNAISQERVDCAKSRTHASHRAACRAKSGGEGVRREPACCTRRRYLSSFAAAQNSHRNGEKFHYR